MMIRAVKDGRALLETAADSRLPKTVRMDLDQLRKQAQNCRACPLWKSGTQTVFGAGSKRGGVIFVGEQPGNEEDLLGQPFVGPAGKLLRKALAEAGLDPAK